MHKFICTKINNKFIIARRNSTKGLEISSKIYNEIVELYSKNAELSDWLDNILRKIGFFTTQQCMIKDIISVSSALSLNYGKASYEITELCNYKCSHCYLGAKKNSSLSLEDKKRIIDMIKESGCLWLQITGGEPLLDSDFVEIYKYAYMLGFLITISTNGSLLSCNDISSTLVNFPPHRLTISMYGVSKESYESLTNIPGSFNGFIQNLEWGRRLKIKIRINIIVNKINENETEKMIQLAESFGFEYYVFTGITPTLYGDMTPTNLRVECELGASKKIGNFQYIKCNAGTGSFHVDSRGKAYICKAYREVYVSLLNENMPYEKLQIISNEVLNKSSTCNNCEFRSECPTCPLTLRLYRCSDDIPATICRKISRKGGEDHEEQCRKKDV